MYLFLIEKSNTEVNGQITVICQKFQGEQKSVKQSIMLGSTIPIEINNIQGIANITYSLIKLHYTSENDFNL